MSVYVGGADSVWVNVQRPEWWPHPAPCENGQAFGLPEIHPLPHNGKLRRRYWRANQITTWAEGQGIQATDGAIGLQTRPG